MITATNYDNFTVILTDTYDGTPAIMGKTYLDFRGDEATLVSATPPHKPSSTGRVCVEDDKGFIHEVYPSVIGLSWVEQA